MGLFSFFKGEDKGQADSDSMGTKDIQTSGNPFVRPEDTLDSYTWLENVQKSMYGSWYVYDVTFYADGYDWEYIRNSAEYMIYNDLTKVVEVKIADTVEYNITEEFMQHGSLLTTPSMNTQRNVLSVAGLSRVLNKNMMIIWFADARGMKFITEFDDETLLKKYAETLLRKNFGTENEMKTGKPIPL